MKVGMGVVVGIVVLLVGLGVWAWVQRGGSERAEEGAVVESHGSSEEAAPGQFMQEVPDSVPAVGEDSEVMMEGEGELMMTGEASGEAVIIAMTDSGFEPATVTIAAGTSVTFVNNGQAAHWPASDVHPTHQQLPEFDSKKGLATGETYSYTFDKVGIWSMHDHLFPQFTGAITVQ